MTNGWGRLVESLVLPGVGPALQRIGYRIRSVTGPTKAQIDDETYEVDTIAVGSDPSGHDVVIAAEIRSRLDLSTVDDWVAKLDKFYRIFPEYCGLDLHGMLAGIRVDEGVPAKAVQVGLFLLVPLAETVKLANPRGFLPRVWSPPGR